MTRTLFSIVRFALTIVLIFIVPSGERGRHTGNSETSSAFTSSTIRCAIDTGYDAVGTSGLMTGFSFEMLKQFSEDMDRNADISCARQGDNWADSLSSGKIDILVRRSDNPINDPGFIEIGTGGMNCRWYIRSDMAEEAKNASIWLGTFFSSKDCRQLQSTFFRNYDPFKRIERGQYSSTLSPYDDLIRQYASSLGWDWRLLAAIVFQESKFSLGNSSHRGASGLMQVMPRTAAYYGITDLIDPEENIKAGTRHLARLQRFFDGEEFSPEEKIKFTLAAYNAGEGRIRDCRAFASYNGKDDTVWDNIVSVIPDMREYSFTYNDTLREGRFRGTETISYVSRVLDIYEAFKEICPSPEDGQHQV